MRYTGGARFAATVMVPVMCLVTACSGSDSGTKGSTAVETAANVTAVTTTTAPTNTAPTNTGTATADLAEIAAGAPMDVPPFADVTAGAAAEAELAVTDAMRVDARFAELLGDIGPAVLSANDAARQEFSETNLGADIEELGIDLTGNDEPIGFRSIATRHPTASPWTGSLLGRASTTVTMTMAALVQATHLSGSEVSGDVSSDHTYRSSPSPGVNEAVAIRTHMTLQAGGGRLAADLDLTSTDTITDASGTQLGQLIGSGRGHIDLNTCPGSDGIAAGNYEIAWTEELSRPGSASAGASLALKAPFRLVNGDDAHLVTIETTLDVARGAHGPGLDGGPPSDWGVVAQIPISISRDGHTTVNYDAITGDSNGAERAHIQQTISGNFMVQMMLVELGKAAEEFWRSGKCIKLSPSEQSREVEPAEQLEISTTSAGAFDNLEIADPITATLDGPSSVEPAGTPQDPPAAVTFTAGPQPGDVGTVKIEQIGRRGIGRASLTFTVRPRNLSVSVSGDYTATGLGNTMVVHVELTVDLVRDSATGDYEVIDAPAAVAATFSGPGCTADFAGEDPLAITVVADEADRDLFRLSVDANAAATTTHTITCPSVSLPISSFITLWASAMQSVELRIGTAATVPTEVTQGQGSITGATQITLLERA